MIYIRNQCSTKIKSFCLKFLTRTKVKSYKICIVLEIGMWFCGTLQFWWWHHTRVLSAFDLLES